MKLYVELNRKEIQEQLPYPIIAEAFSRSIWKTGRRKRLMMEYFAEDELDRVEEIGRRACQWAYVRGVPDSVKMDTATYDMWQRVGEFCAGL